MILFADFSHFSGNFLVDTKRNFYFSYESARKTRMNVIDHLLISHQLVPEILTFKELKHDTETWFSANNNNSQNYDIIRFA